ncbi:MAG: glycosyltransferase family 39 protein, partial [Bacteroidota bacterium]|nr:glycosyltransferase family 39 protein [Bacteroidota bacterium]
MKNRPTVAKYSEPFVLDYAEKTSDAFLICIPILLLLIITLPFIASGYWEDEIFSVTASHSWAGLLGIFRNYENNMSLYYVLLHVWMKFFGEAEIATHALSLLFALLTIPVFFKLERIWLNKSTALTGALLFAANPLFVYYALESRSYSLLILSATVSTLLFARLQRKPGYLQGICYGLSVVAATYTHYFGILLIPVHGLTILWNKPQRKQLKYFTLPVLVIFLGILPLLLFPPRNRSQIDWLSKPDLECLGRTLKDLFGGWWVFLILAICMFFVVRNRKFASVDRRFLSRLSIAWTILPACLLFIFSYLVKPVFLTRFFVWCLPGSALLTCLTVEYTGWNRVRKSMIWLLLLFILLKKSYGTLSTKGSGYKEAVQYLNEQIRPGESVLTYPYYKSIHASYYLTRMPYPNPLVKPLPITRLPYLPGGGGRDPDPDMQALNNVAAGYDKVYLMCKEGSTPTNADSMQNRTWLPQIQ